MSILYHRNYSLKKFNTWHLQGQAEYLVLPRSSQEFIELIQNNSMGSLITCIGLGSNVLIRDGGIPGLVCITYPGLSFIKLTESNVIDVGAGTPCAQIARFCFKRKLTGLEFFAGIPGTVGGALYMNAGAFGSETWQYLHKVCIVNDQGLKMTRIPSQFKIGYRKIEGLDKNEYFLSAKFKLRENKYHLNDDHISKLLKKRASLQPIGLPSCGSVFKNAMDYNAAELIDSSGLKGYRIEKTYVSSKHANFIIAEKGAKAEHIERLMEHIIETVKKKYGIILKPEVEILGKHK